MNMKAIKIFILLTFVFLSSLSYAQRGHGRGGGHGNGHRKGRAVAHRSHYRPANIVVYHPHWRPAYDYHRRWVYFPRHNMYWDNWRNHYVYVNEGVWVSRPTAPVTVVNINLDTEKSTELREDEDDNDDIYKSNDNHKTQYKTD